jgi:hypothetical protein
MADSTNVPDSDTPGKPTDHSSRQQTRKDQSAQTGSRELDKDSGSQDGKGGKKVPLVPPGAK